ncbi:12-oxophytodienoate reductase [Nocardia sp. CDC153]|uniref:oxidoreductase n=1 Tax=Nocardia sp. CDC153 TaxID=3112167 RepID=UPI002DB7C920|nr:12-oxophytodienoate reductase [Nocardia sp. CDC153]MEC3954104.1 12-oxophytodienoate reductase [Nocardia sp. CDC153]
MRNALDADLDLSALFTPSAIGTVAVRNRFAMAPLSRYAARRGIPAPELGAFYRRRAAGGAGLIISEGISIGDGPAGSGVAGIRDAGAVTAWKRIVDAVHAERVPIFAQLMREQTSGSRPVETERTIAGYVAAARQARVAGFDGVEIHAAHGLLPTRSSFGVELVAAVRAELGPTVPITYRFSQWRIDRYDDRVAETPADLEAMLRPLAEAGVAAFHPSTRRFDEPGFPETGGPRGQLSLAGWTRAVTGRPAIIVGSIGLAKRGDAAEAVDSLVPLLRRFERGEFDIAAVGRAVLANPDFVDLLRTGRAGDLVPYDEHRHKATLR